MGCDIVKMSFWTVPFGLFFEPSYTADNRKLPDNKRANKTANDDTASTKFSSCQSRGPY